MVGKTLIEQVLSLKAMGSVKRIEVLRLLYDKQSKYDIFQFAYVVLATETKAAQIIEKA